MKGMGETYMKTGPSAGRHAGGVWGGDGGGRRNGRKNLYSRLRDEVRVASKGDPLLRGRVLYGFLSRIFCSARNGKHN